MKRDESAIISLYCRHRALVILATASLAVGLWWAIRPAPEQLLRRALSISHRDPAEAEQLLRRALSASGGRYPDAQIALCRLQGSQGAWDEALTLFAETERPACRADLLLEFGRIAYQAGYRPEALSSLAEVRRRGTRESIVALELLMADFRDWEEHAELIDAARELTRLEPDNPDRWLELVELLTAMHRDEECLETLRDGIGNQELPEEIGSELRHRLVDRLIVQGDVAAAKQELIELQNREGRSLRVLADEIDISRLEGNLEQALATVTEVFPQIRNQPEAYLTRGGIFLEMGRFAEAVRDLERASAGRPRNEAIHFKLAEAYRGLEQHDAARKHREVAAEIGAKRAQIAGLLKALIDDPQNNRICREIANLHRQLDETEAAERWTRRAAKAASRKASK